MSHFPTLPHTQALEDLYTHYDMTVRNAASGMVQFMYGDDGMDPVTMEGKDAKPLDFKRLLEAVGLNSNVSRGEENRLGCWGERGTAWTLLPWRARTQSRWTSSGCWRR